MEEKKVWGKRKKNLQLFRLESGATHQSYSYDTSVGDFRKVFTDCWCWLKVFLDGWSKTFKLTRRTPSEWVTDFDQTFWGDKSPLKMYKAEAVQCSLFRDALGMSEKRPLTALKVNPYARALTAQRWSVILSSVAFWRASREHQRHKLTVAHFIVKRYLSNNKYKISLTFIWLIQIELQSKRVSTGTSQNRTSNVTEETNLQLNRDSLQSSDNDYTTIIEKTL